MTARIDLTEAQFNALQSIARQTGRSQDDLVREAVDRFLQEEAHDVVDWRERLRAGEGLWEQRDDLPDFAMVRREMDRDLWSQGEQ
jgi:hypothetical protein